ncbi:hypothetical protein HMI55_005515 [Coelomomyces lativittatus]|nr:hypothetical protein HMI55_005515 [Coelomomyces lativittatus]
MSFVDIQSHLDVPTRNFVVHPMTCLGLKVAFFMSSLYGIDLLGLRNPPLSTSLSLLMSPWSLASSSFNKHEVEEQENASNAEEKHPFHGCFLPRDTSTSSSPPSLMDALLPSNVYRKKHVFHSTMLKRPSFKPHLLRNTSGLSMNENDEGLTSPVFYFQKNPQRDPSEWYGACSEYKCPQSDT